MEQADRQRGPGAHRSIVNDIVVVRTVDGHIEALALPDGDGKWAVDEQVPRLTLRGTAPPVLAGDRIVAGFDNGKVLAIDPRNGEVMWDAIVNAPRGRTELERLVRYRLTRARRGRRHLRRGFPGARRDARARLRPDLVGAGCFELSRLRDGRQNLYLTNSDSVVIAMRRTDGAVQWEQDAMKRRRLTAPAIDGDSLVVGDFEGFLHWLDMGTGEIVARQKADGERISNSHSPTTPVCSSKPIPTSCSRFVARPAKQKPPDEAKAADSGP